MTNWQHERRMTPRQFKGVIKTMGMTQSGAGRFVGVSERTLRRWIAGEAEVPASAVLLLRSMIHHGDKPLVPERS